MSILEEQKISYDAMLIESITSLSEKLKFLQRYGDQIDVIDTKELVESFRSLNVSVQEVFLCPVLLTLFISLFLNNRKSLSQLHNEQSTYKAIRDEIFSKEIKAKLKNKDIKNAELRTEDLLEVISDYSLRLFRNCLLYTSPSPRDKRQSRMPSSA